jgi:DNA invertase Pin-like site-specific DNA recombinase
MRRKARSVARAPIAYCGASSAAQGPDLEKQRRVLEDFCAARGVANVAFIEDAGAGLDLRRPKFVTIIDRVGARDYRT